VLKYKYMEEWTHRYGHIKALNSCPFKKEFCASFSNTCKYYEFGMKEIKEMVQEGLYWGFSENEGKCIIPKSIRFLKGLE